MPVFFVQYYFFINILTRALAFSFTAYFSSGLKVKISLMASNENEPFVQLSENDISLLIGTLKENLPDSYHALAFAMNVVELKDKIPGYHIYAPKGDYTDTTFLICGPYQEGCVGTYYSQSEEGCRRLLEALQSTQLFNKAKALLISAVHDRVYQLVGLSWSRWATHIVTPCHLYSISSEDALKLNPPIPDDVEVKQLRVEDAELVDSLWPHRDEGSVNVIRTTIQHVPCIGLYRKSDGKLLSWVLKWFYGGLGILQTVDEAKRKGYAQIVVAELSKVFARSDWPIHATVLTNNTESNPLFDKMGFTKQFLCHYIDSQ